MREKVTIKIKHPLLQIFCRHKYGLFEKPIDWKTNPYGFRSLNEETIQVCTKCGKRTD